MTWPKFIALATFALGLAACGSSAPTGSSDAGSFSDAGSMEDAGSIVDAGATEDAGSSTDAGEVDAGPPDAGRLGSTTVLLWLDAGAFPPTPTHPSALVYVPDGFNPTPPIDLVVYIHGFDNCVENIVRDGGQSCEPDAGGPERHAYNLAGQLDVSGKNALLIAPEVEYDQVSGNPGNLGLDGGLRALLAETLQDLSPMLGGATIDDVGEVIVTSHSGGYVAAGAMATRGGMPVTELWLFDSLYGETSEFDSWVTSDLASFNPVVRRWADVYTCCGGTLTNSQDMATRAAGWVGTDGGTLVDDRTTSTWTPDVYRHGLLFKSSALAHDGVPRYYFGQLLQTSTLHDR